MASAGLPESGRLLVVGLGNPGSKYEGTRHNIGFDVAYALAERNGIAVREKNFDGLVGSGTICGRPATIVLPQSYMNLSGFSVSRAASFYKVPPEGIIVLHDDIDLGLGVVRLKIAGGHGGHNGLRSIDQQLGTRAYHRVRLGVGRPEHGDVSGWVLAKFGKADQALAEDLKWDGPAAVEQLIELGLQAAQNKVHSK